MKKEVLLRKFYSAKSKFTSLFTLQSWKKIEACDVLLYCHDANRPFKMDGKAYAPLIDSLADELEKNGLTCSSLALPYCKLLGDKATRSPKSINFNYFIVDILRSLKFKKTSFEKHVKTIRRVLRRSKCKAVIGISLDKAFCQAAHAEGVKAVELMHGIGYTYAPSYYQDEDANKLADVFFALDQVSADSIDAVKHESQKALVIQHPWFAKLESEPELAKPPQSLLEKKKAFKNAIIVTLQWGYDGEEPLHDGIIENGIMLESLEKAISNTPDTMWVLRLHPVQYRGERYVRHKQYVKDLEQKLANCFCFDYQEAPLTDVLFGCDGHITMNSMACYEAAWLGLPSLVLCPMTRGKEIYANYFEDLEAANYVSKIDAQVSGITDWVNGAKKLTPYKPPSASSAGSGDAVSTILEICHHTDKR